MFKIFIAVIFILFFADSAGAQELASSAASVATPETVLPDDVKFVLLTLGGGGLAGWAVGFTLKKVAKTLALVLGIGFIAIQSLAYHHFITIDWERIKKTVPDSKLEESAGSLMSMLTYNLPFAGSFVVGFWMGFRKG